MALKRKIAFVPIIVSLREVKTDHSSILNSFYPISFYSILFYSILFYSILFYSILFYSILFYSILFYSILFYSILFIFSSNLSTCKCTHFKPISSMLNSLKEDAISSTQMISFSHNRTSFEELRGLDKRNSLVLQLKQS